MATRISTKPSKPAPPRSSCEHVEDGVAAVPHLVVRDARKALGLLLSRYYRIWPTPAALARFKLLGVTGTNGKTTITYLMQHHATPPAIRCGRITTIDRDLGTGEPLVSNNTTPASDRSLRRPGHRDRPRLHATASWRSPATPSTRAASPAWTSPSPSSPTSPATTSTTTRRWTTTRRQGQLFHAACAPQAAAVINADDPYCDSRHGRRLPGAASCGIGLKNPADDLAAVITGMRRRRHADFTISLQAATARSTRTWSAGTTSRTAWLRPALPWPLGVDLDDDRPRRSEPSQPVPGRLRAGRPTDLDLPLRRVRRLRPHRRRAGQRARRPFAR